MTKSTTKSKRPIAWGVIVVALIAGIAGICWNLFGLHEVKLTQQELQQRIDVKMPHTTKNGVTVSAVHLDLTGDRIGLIFTATAKKMGTEFTITAQTRGTLVYNNLEGTFRFKPEELQLVDVKTNGESVATRFNRFVDKWVDSPKILDRKDELAASASELVNSLIQKGAEMTLERVPVYKMPDTFKGNIARMFLESVEVQNQTVIAHLSFWQFTKIMLLYGFVIVLAIGFAVVLIANPEMLMAVAIIGSIGGN